MGTRRLAGIIFLLLAAVLPVAAETFDLKCDFLSDPLGIDSCTPSFSWKVGNAAAGDRQTGCRILVASSMDRLERDDGDLWDSGRMKTRNQIAVKYDGAALVPGQHAYWKVKVWTRKGGEQDWSPSARFSVGLLRPEDWKADFMCMDSETDSPMFRKRFDVLSKDGLYLLHVNSLGFHEVYLNGTRVGDAVLQPAVCQADKRSLICTYDVTGLIVSGTNDIVVWISDGWNRVYEDRLCARPAVRVQLQNCGSGGTASDILCSDSTWLARESGWSVSGSWKPFFFGGDIADAGKVPVDFTPAYLDALGWVDAGIARVRPHTASPQMVEPCRKIREIAPVSVCRNDDGSWLADFGTCLTGMLEMEFPPLGKGCRIEFDYADCLNDDGSFPTVRRGDFKDVYIASGLPGETFANRFNFHGFRYVRIDGLPSAPAALKAYLVHTDYGRGSEFGCSDPDMNAIHDMVKYTVECLTPGGYMIDCPTIERLGYGGDGNASTPTLQTMFPTAALMYNWSTAWADALREDGGMPHTAPAPYGAGGGPFWCGFLVAASWQSLVRFGDDRLVTRFYPQMKEWLAYSERYFKNGILQRWGDDPIRRNYYLGDWAAPEKVDVGDSLSVSLVTNCFMAECYETMGRIADYNHDRRRAVQYRRHARELREILHERFYDGSGKYATGSQIDMCYPMLSGVTPPAETDKVVSALRDSIASLYDGNLAAGLMGVPIVTRWATSAGESDLMYSMLKKRTYPGYLYMLDNGATTTWEYWNGYRSHIHNCYNGIGSWFYEALAGIVPDMGSAGFSHFYVKPQPAGTIDHAMASVPTPYGCIRVEWNRNGDVFSLRLSVPFGTRATVILPGSRRNRTVGCGEYEFSAYGTSVSRLS